MTCPQLTAIGGGFNRDQPNSGDGLRAALGLEFRSVGMRGALGEGRMMQRVLVTVSVAAAFCVSSLPSMAQSAEDWTTIKGPKALSALYADRTFEGKDAYGEWIGHYRADGKGVLISGGLRRPRTWKVSGNDQVCETEGTRTRCFTFERQRGNPNRVRKREVGRNHYDHFTVKDGVPKF